MFGDLSTNIAASVLYDFSKKLRAKAIKIESIQYGEHKKPWGIWFFICLYYLKKGNSHNDFRKELLPTIQ